MPKTEYEGLWKSSKTAWYVSKGFTKKQLQAMPARFRLILRENRYHQNNNDGTPRFIFRFVDADAANELRFGRNEAEWKYSEGFEGASIIYHWKCSECGGEPYYGGDIHEYKYCPYCGAQMDGGDNEA